MARLYSNENFPLPVVARLRALGHDVLTIQETGKADQALPDKEVLAFATREQRAVLTLNRLHFIRLHRAQPAHAGTMRLHEGVVKGSVQQNVMFPPDGVRPS